MIISLILSFLLSFAPASQAASETPAYDVVVTSVGASKIAVIKVVREYTNCSLKDAKDLIDKVSDSKTPVVVFHTENNPSATELKALLEEAGAEVKVVTKESKKE